MASYRLQGNRQVPWISPGAYTNIDTAHPAYLPTMNTRLYRLQRRLRLMHPTFTNREPLILRDHLALERTRLSNERTLLSYIRSSLYLLIGGIALIQVEGYGDLRYVGYLALLICVLSLVVGFYRFHRLRNQLDRYAGMQRGRVKQENLSDGA